MGIHERRQRERQARRQGILDAAQQLAVRDGWQAVTIRDLAALIEYSPPAIYEHFDGKDAILRQLAQDGFGLLLAAVRAKRDAGASPETQIRQLCLAFWDFARDNPALYDLMHSLSCPRGHDAGRPTDATEVLADVGVVLRAISPTLDEESIREAEDLLWATLHGLVTLHLNHWLPGGDSRGRRLVERAVDQWLSAVAKHPESLSAGQL